MFTQSSKRIILPFQAISLVAMVIHLVLIHDNENPYKIYSKEVPVAINAIVLFIMSLRVPKEAVVAPYAKVLSVAVFIFYGIGDYILVLPTSHGSANRFMLGAAFFLVGHYLYLFVLWSISKTHNGGFSAVFGRFPERKSLAKKLAIVSAVFVSLMVITPNKAGRILSVTGGVYLAILSVTIYYGLGTWDDIEKCKMSCLGTACFQLSDTVLSTNDFLFSCPWFRHFYMVTYWMATSFYFNTLASYFDGLVGKKVETKSTPSSHTSAVSPNKKKTK